MEERKFYTDALDSRKNADEQRLERWLKKQRIKFLPTLVSDDGLISKGSMEFLLTPNPLPSFSYPLLRYGVGQGDGMIKDELNKDTIYRDNEIWRWELTSQDVLKMLQSEIDRTSYKPTMYQEKEILISRKDLLKIRFKRALKTTGGDITEAITLAGQMKQRKEVERTEKEANALIVYMMSVTEDALNNTMRNRGLKLEHWMNMLIGQEYSHVENLYITYAGDAEIKSKERFYNSPEKISSPRVSAAYDMYGKIVDAHPKSNIFLVQFSNGEDSPEDLATALKHVKNFILPKSRLFGYFELNQFGDSQMTKSMEGVRRYFSHGEIVRPSKVFSDEQILSGLLDFFGRKKD